MPLRLLRPTIRTSERWQRAKYFDRCFYISLLSLVDDYGRYEANTTLLASECFPYGSEEGLPVTASQIDGALRALASKDLLFVYVSKNKTYLQLTRWNERKRSESKYPDPKTCEIVWKSEDCEQPLAVASERQQMHASPPTPTPTPTPVPTPTPTPSAVPTPKSEARVCDQKAEFQKKTRFEWLSKELCAFYQRPRETVSMGEEEQIVLEVSQRPDVRSELEQLRKYRAEIGQRYFPQSLKKLCYEWQDTLDKSRNHAPAPKTMREMSIIEREITQIARSEGVL